MTIAPDRVDRFRRDLAAVWPSAHDPTARLGLAVSGGGDSLALLSLAHDALPRRIAVATVDHGLRPESADEAAMVAQACRALGLAHETLTVTVEPGNVQDRARSARYGALSEWCARQGLAALATAHQLDDQVETLVMRLNRGSGIAGLAGVRARGEVGVPVVRPLLGWRRAELAQIAVEAGLVPVADPSNEDERFDRVRVRKALAGADWLDPARIARSAALLGEAEAYISEQIDLALAARVSLAEDGVRMIPGPSDFEAAELAMRIIASLGGKASRSETAELVARLRQRANASLGGVLARPADGTWVFAAEPRRTNHLGRS